jgi:hypothetical protein
MIAENMESGKKYFCEYSTSIDPENFPMLAGKEIPALKITGFGQIIRRDVESKLCVVADLKTRQEYIVAFGDIKSIEEVA